MQCTDYIEPEGNLKTENYEEIGTVVTDVRNKDLGNQFNISKPIIQTLIINSNPAFAPAGVMETDGPLAIQSEPKAVDRFRLPIAHFKETKKYKDILKGIQSKKTLILHCHGFPGSGKSEIIRKLAEQFPFTGSKSKQLFIRWHIQCCDSNHDVKTELEELLKLMRKNSLLSDDDLHQNIIKNMNNDYANPLTEFLQSCRMPVLIIIEDVQESNKIFLEEFLRSLRKVDEEATKETPPFHVYLTSRKKSSDLCEEEYKKMKYYQMEIIAGFNKNEGIELLNDGMKDKDTESAAKVYSRFSGLPLGLQAAKLYCKTTHTNYRDYLQCLKDEGENDIQEYEKNNLKKDYGRNGVHVFQAITMPFQVKKDRFAIQQWRVLCCLSQLHYDRIPRHLLEKCCQELREIATRHPAIKNRTDAANIVGNLLDCEMCTETDEKDITFHEVVNHAFRLNCRNVTDVDLHGVGYFDPLISTVEIMAGILSKDMRKKDNSNRMYKLIRHNLALIEKIEKEEDPFPEDNACFLWMLTSHIYETIASVMLAKSYTTYHKQCIDYFEKALIIVWGEDKLYSLADEEDTGPDEIAKYVVAVSRAEGEKLPHDFVEKYASIVLHLDEDEFDYLEERGKRKYKRFKTAYDSQAPTKELIPKLRDCGVFLDSKQYRSVFLAERISTILHCWSRVILYKDSSDVNGDDQYMWLSTLSRAISAECKRSCQVGLLNEHLSTTGGLIPILLKLKKSEENLNKAKLLCEKALNEKGRNNFDMYENGLLRKVFNPDQNVLLKHLVRVHARLVKTNPGAKFMKQGDDYCKRLFDFSVTRCQTLSSALICVIYCAKYHAAKGDFDQSLRCLHTYFDQAKICFDDPKSHKPRHNVNCWAIYNYARAVRCGKFEGEREKVIQRCEEVLDSPEVMGRDLNDKLKEELRRVRNEEWGV